MSVKQFWKYYVLTLHLFWKSLISVCCIFIRSQHLRECNFLALKYKLPCNVKLSDTPESYFSASLSPLKWKRDLGVISVSQQSSMPIMLGSKVVCSQVLTKTKLVFQKSIVPLPIRRL